MNVSEEDTQLAKECMEKPLFDFVSTDDIKKSPLKRRVSLAGKVVAVSVYSKQLQFFIL